MYVVRVQDRDGVVREYTFGTSLFEATVFAMSRGPHMRASHPMWRDA